ncbi:MAG: hypothetical protein HKN04_09320 [Rhodothermaceae bacterium]|nr:hypothetical protein [Rhodothermaceae bacterium]
MSRLLTVLGFVALLLIGVAAIVGLLAYGNEPVRSGRLTLEDLSQPAAVAWDEDGRVVIEATNERDLAAALGYAHAADDAWAMALWRQAAIGGLAEWFGPTQRQLDRHARMLGFATLAERTYEALPDNERALLEAHAHGVNAALRQNPVAQRDEFVLLDLEPTPWLPWHALAIERLVAWLGTPPLGTDSAFGQARTDPAIARFATTDSLFRAFLYLGGARQSRAWVAPLDSTTTTFVQQHPYGASALPLMRAVTLRQGSEGLTAATIPGTLLFPGGQTADRAWSVFLTSDATLTPFDSLLPPPVYDRLVDRNGDETLLTINRSDDGLFFKSETSTQPAARADTLVADSTAAFRPSDPALKTPSAWVLQWSGLAPGTDLSAWRALRDSTAAAFRLFRGDGLVMTRSESPMVLGDPPIRSTLPGGGVFIAADTLARYAAEHLAALIAANASTPQALTRDATSPWAAAQLAGLLAALGHRDSLTADLKDPYAFLLSWDARYTEDAVGAALFETWLRAHRSITGAWPIPADSSNRPLLQQTLRLAVAMLRDQHGDRPSAWRWESVQRGARTFPVWGDSTQGLVEARYAPSETGLGGHPTALRLGPSLVFGEPPAPAVWTAWLTTTDWDAWTIQHPVVEAGGLLGRTGEVFLDTEPLVVQRSAALTDPVYLRPPDAP